MRPTRAPRAACRVAGPARQRASTRPRRCGPISSPSARPRHRLPRGQRHPRLECRLDAERLRAQWSRGHALYEPRGRRDRLVDAHDLHLLFRQLAQLVSHDAGDFDGAPHPGCGKRRGEHGLVGRRHQHGHDALQPASSKPAPTDDQRLCRWPGHEPHREHRHEPLEPHPTITNNGAGNASGARATPPNTATMLSETLWEAHQYWSGGQVYNGGRTDRDSRIPSNGQLHDADHQHLPEEFPDHPDRRSAHLGQPGRHPHRAQDRNAVHRHAR